MNDFSSLTDFYAVQSNIDLALIPMSVSTFETFQPNSNNILKLEEQKIWTTLGLKKLYEENKFKRCYYNEIDHNGFRLKEFHNTLVKMLKGEMVNECKGVN